MKELNIDPIFKQTFQQLKEEFKHIETLVALLADLLDMEMP